MINPAFYSIELSLLTWILTGLSVLCALLLMWLWAGRARRVWRKSAADSKEDLPEGGYPSVSVIVTAHGEGRNLAMLLPAILEQDYPGETEVIVVTDEGAGATADVVGALQLQHPNLYMTYVPDDARNLSRRKLCITLGVKAARYDYVVLTEGNCRIQSPLWLSSMMRHAVDGADVVLGYACDVDAAKGDDARRLSRGARLRNFDRVWNAVRWLGAAIAGHPYRGCAANLVYRRRLFFDHKGFSKSLNLIYGDDDLFVNEIADKHNCAVELSPASRVDVLRTMPRYMHTMERRMREFTASMLPKAPRIAMGFCSLLWWVWLGTAVAAGYMGYPSLVPVAVVVVVGVAMLVSVSRQWRKCCVALGASPQLWSVPFMALWHPFYNLRYKWSAKRHRKHNYTNMV